MTTKYLIVPEKFEHFYSDSVTEKAEPIMGVKPRDPNNVAYVLYNKPYGKFQSLGGCNLLFPKSIPYTQSMLIDFNADNITTNITANSFAQQVFYRNNDVRAFMGMPAMDKLDNGKIECYGSVTDLANNIVYIMQSFYFDIQKP